MTTLVDATAQRIETQVPALAGAIEYVADFAALIAANALPQRDLTAFVIPAGFDAGKGESAVNAHTQAMERAISVVLVIKARGDAKARSAVPKIDTLELAIVRAVAGWAPDNVVGVFNVTRGRLVSVENGLVIYQIDFRLVDQLRIIG
jgi:hypothetical protein